VGYVYPVGTSILWGTNAIAGTDVLGNSILWGTGGLQADSILWGTGTVNSSTVQQGTSILWGTNNSSPAQEAGFLGDHP
jgi:hypothetical protein